MNMDIVMFVVWVREGVVEVIVELLTTKLLDCPKHC